MTMPIPLTEKGAAFHHKTLDKTKNILQVLLNWQTTFSEETEAQIGDHWCYTNLFLHMWVKRIGLDGVPFHDQFWIILDCLSDTAMKFTFALGGQILDEFQWETNQGDGVIALWINHVCNRINDFEWKPYVG